MKVTMIVFLSTSIALFIGGVAFAIFLTSSQSGSFPWSAVAPVAFGVLGIVVASRELRKMNRHKRS